jgi:hypothetical protein
VPRKISSASDAAQIATTRRTWDLAKPCRITKAFWAPMAMMRERPVNRPGRNAITYRYYFESLNLGTKEGVSIILRRVFIRSNAIGFRIAHAL